jgi:hypothetical protein
MTRHILGVLGVLAALVLLVVSAMMNYQFGYNYGKTPVDGLIYGMASAAADCFKALTPFFFFAALRNRIWSQALAAALVWVVVTVYAFLSALGHASTNRSFTNGERVVASASYQDTRAELKRAEEQLKWIPPHRPTSTVAAELHVLKADKTWLLTKECTDATRKTSREFCQQYFKLAAEYASGQETDKLNAKIAQLGVQTTKVSGAAATGLADPQANLISRLTGYDLETVQTGLMLFVALLIEIGSGFGLYVAFAYWRPNQSLHGDHAPRTTTAEARPVRREEKPEAPEDKKDEAPPTGKADPIWTAEPATVSADAKSGPPAVRPFGDNDNQTAVKPAIMPPNDVQRFYQDCVDGNVAKTSYVGAMKLNEAYKLWCKRNGRRPLVMPNFLSEFDDLKVDKHEIGGGVKYFGIALKADVERDLEQKGTRKRKSALGHGSHEQSKPAVEPATDEATAASEQLRAAADEMRESLEPQPKAATGEAKAA